MVQVSHLIAAAERTFRVQRVVYVVFSRETRGPIKSRSLVVLRLRRTPSLGFSSISTNRPDGARLTLPNGVDAFPHLRDRDNTTERLSAVKCKPQTALLLAASLLSYLPQQLRRDVAIPNELARTTRHFVPLTDESSFFSLGYTQHQHIRQNDTDGRPLLRLDLPLHSPPC